MHFTRKDIYDVTTVKYLVLVKDEVEQGDQRMKELECELQQIGLFESDFSLGDILEDPEEEKPQEPLKKKLPDFPTVEGDESLVEYIGQYKKACLTRKALLKTTKERLEKDKAKDFEQLVCTRVVCIKPSHEDRSQSSRGFVQSLGTGLSIFIARLLGRLQGLYQQVTEVECSSEGKQTPGITSHFLFFKGVVTGLRKASYAQLCENIRSEWGAQFDQF